jgi:hypothetical protein
MVNNKMKKTYNQPTCLVVELRGRDAILTSVSGNYSLDDTSWGGTTSSVSGGVSEGDVKGITDVNLWDNEW